MSRFVQGDRQRRYVLPPWVQDWLPEDHLARSVVDVVEALDRSERVRPYAGRGSDAHHPGTLLALLIDGYATGVHPSRAIERARHDSVAFRFIAGNTHPDHDTIATFRGRFAGEIKARFVQVRLMAQANGRMKLGKGALDGTQVKANATRIMRVQGQGFEPCYHAPLAVDRESRLIVAPGLTQELNDKQPFIPALQRRRALPPERGTVQARVADNGFMSEANVRACAVAEAEDATPIAPLMALGREPHHADLMQRFGPERLGPAPPDRLAAMAHRLTTREGRAR